MPPNKSLFRRGHLPSPPSTVSRRFRKSRRYQRVNSVSPTVLEEAMDHYAPFFRGFKPVQAAEVALAYAKSVEGLHTGQTYQVG